MKKLVVGITAPGSVILIDGQLKYFKSLGYDTYLLAPPHERVAEYCEREGCTHLPVEIEREISPKKDLKSLLQIYRHFKKIKPDVVNLGTPKVSLLGMTAAKLLGVKNRIYTCRGYRFEHEAGKKKSILIFMEKLTAKWAHKIICISDSVRDLGLSHNLFPADKAVVINKGSSNGFDLSRFTPAAVIEADRQQKKAELKLEDAFVFGFVGRLVDRKGIKELYTAFDELYTKNNKLRLLVVGPVEYEQISDKTLIDKMNAHPGIIMTGSQRNVPLYLSLMDVFVLPAWWEGFGNVLVQAAAMGLPVISTYVTGCKDAVSHNYNGILIKDKSPDELKNVMLQFYDDSSLRERLGNNGIEWAKNFDSKIIWNGMDKLYQKA
jgi:glycosyltransferase involved in cell wall biosynthesis